MHAHACTHARIRTRVRAHTHTHTYTHTRARPYGYAHEIGMPVAVEQDIALQHKKRPLAQLIVANERVSGVSGLKSLRPKVTEA